MIAKVESLAAHKLRRLVAELGRMAASAEGPEFGFLMAAASEATRALRVLEGKR